MNDADRVLMLIMDCEICLYTTLYAPDKAVVSMCNICTLLPDIPKARVKRAVKELMSDGMIYYTSQGRPAVMSCGEVPELVCEAAPPLNGYALTEYAFGTALWKNRYDEWCKSMEDWANGELDGEATD